MALFDRFRNKEPKDDNGSPASRPPAQAASVPPASPNQAAPGTRIGYNGSLIHRLHSDHRAISALFLEIRAAANARQFGKAAELMPRFRSALQDHLLTENVRLYVYLAHLLEADPDNRALVREFQREMHAIGRQVVDFLTRYAHLGEDSTLASSFLADLEQVGKVLQDRIRREEEILYPLYVPSL